MSSIHNAILGMLAFLIFGSAACFYEAWLLISRRNLRSLRIYKLDGSELHSKLATHHGILVALLGVWFLCVPLLAIAWQISITSWAGLVALGSMLFLFGKVVVEKKHGLPRS